MYKPVLERASLVPLSATVVKRVGGAASTRRRFGRLHASAFIAELRSKDQQEAFWTEIGGSATMRA